MYQATCCSVNPATPGHSQIALTTGIYAYMAAILFTDTEQHETGQLDDTIEQANGFSQIFPRRKYNIVDVLQQRSHIIGRPVTVSTMHLS
jgi:hypothetical protein